MLEGLICERVRHVSIITGNAKNAADHRSNVLGLQFLNSGSNIPTAA
jgi:hypothetical protein